MENKDAAALTILSQLGLLPDQNIKPEYKEILDDIADPDAAMVKKMKQLYGDNNGNNTNNNTRI